MNNARINMFIIVPGKKTIVLVCAFAPFVACAMSEDMFADA